MAKILRRKKKESATSDKSTYNRQKLLTILKSIIKPALTSKNEEESFKVFVFTGKNILTYNEKICICYPFKTGFKGSVPAEEIKNILSSIKDEDVSINLDGSKLIIESENTSAELKIEEVNEDIKEIGEKTFDKSQYITLPSNFIEAVSSCMFTASKDVNQSVLRCLYINNKEVLSSDDFRISSFTMNGKVKDKMLIPASLIQELVKFDAISYFKEDNLVYFLTKEGAIFCIRIVDGRFPEASKEFEFDADSISFPADFIDIVKNASVLASGEFDVDKKIEVKINGGKISCKGENDLGWIESKTDIDSKKKFTFIINPNFLLQVLTKSCIMKMGEGKVMFETENFKHLISLYMEE